MKKSALSIFMIFVLLLMLTSCDSGLYIIKISISQYPKKIAYFLHKDTELDLQGLEICVESKAGTKSIKQWNEVYADRPYFDISNNVNFFKPGVYVVTIKCNEARCLFAVEVIDLSRIK